ncbi:MAG TPA: hypothetical protein VMZ27_16430 [Candidatus Saccharimonadales bacterium]|nr:hypothetical protein [Candidatus Saccharimonadales bacterium]
MLSVSRETCVVGILRLLTILLLAGNGFAAEKKPLSFQVQPGHFPPEGSAQYVAGELIQMDHVNRTGQLRPDRRDDQRTDDYDRAMLFTLLPYGTLRYHGAPAELRDIPIGTHLHGQFYFDAKTGRPARGGSGLGFLLEDDFSFMERQQRVWRLDAVNLPKGTITVTGVSAAENKPDAKQTIYKVNPATRVWTEQGFGTLSNLAAGQSLLLNITVATLKGPGRCTDIWLDEESKRLASAGQTEVHRAYEKAHGLPGWIDAVDNEKSLVTLTLFGGFDPALTNDFKLKSRVAALVAEDSLRCYDQINDRMYCELLEMKSVPVVPGSSGLQMVIKPENLLEGFRPHRILRLLPDRWPLDDLPWEEMLWPADNRVK